VASGAERFVLELELPWVFVWFGVTAEVTSDAKCWIDACSLALDDSVTSGIQRKCVNGGLGGMTEPTVDENPCAR